jgi:bacteriocin-like protein
MKKGAAEDFLKQHGCEATTEEFSEFLESKAKEGGPLELSKDELASVSGGTSYYCGEPCSRGETSDCSDTCIRDCC